MPTREVDRFSKVYWRIATEYPAVYADDDALAWLVRLWVLGDQCFPALPPLPLPMADEGVVGDGLDTLPALRARVVLEEAGLIRIVDGWLVEVRGMVKEHARRESRGYRGGVQRAASAGRDTLGRM